MRALKSILLVTSLLIFNFIPVTPAHADSLSAKFLEIPYKSGDGGFGNQDGSPFTIEFSGTLVTPYSNCKDFLATQEPHFIFQVQNSVYEPWIGAFSVNTVSVTKDGLVCSFRLVSGDTASGSNDVKFGPGDEKFPLTITYKNHDNVITTGQGFLYNSGFVPKAVQTQIEGISRGDVVNGYKILKFNSSEAKLGNPLISICAIDGNDCHLGWGVLKKDGSLLIVTNVAYVGKFANLKIEWSYKNSTGQMVPLSASQLIQVGKSTDKIPWEIIREFKDFFTLYTTLDCANKVTAGQSLECEISTQIRDNYHNEFTNSEVVYNLSSQLDTGKIVKLSPIIITTGNKVGISLKVPPLPWNRWIFKLDNSYLSDRSSSLEQIYGELPKPKVKVDNGPKVILKFPKFVLWNKPFIITASSTSGALQSCVFSMSQDILGSAKSSKGVAKISVVAVWTGEVGTSTKLYYSAKCLINGKYVIGSGSVTGFR